MHFVGIPTEIPSVPGAIGVAAQAPDKQTKGLKMRLTTRGRFAVTAMIDLGLRQHNGPVALAAISDRQKISLSYLEQLFGKLRRHALVESTRGPGGGYMLARTPSDVTVAEIIAAVDEPLDATQCAGKENCDDDQRCMTHELWAQLNKRMMEYLESVTLNDLVEQQRARPVQSASTPISVLKDQRVHEVASSMAAG
jgi:Rrf2 family transcriptional regulator, iron-sulfur cluster assembly transcription factor